METPKCQPRINHGLYESMGVLPPISINSHNLILTWYPSPLQLNSQGDSQSRVGITSHAEVNGGQHRRQHTHTELCIAACGDMGPGWVCWDFCHDWRRCDRKDVVLTSGANFAVRTENGYGLKLSELCFSLIGRFHLQSHLASSFVKFHGVHGAKVAALSQRTDSSSKWFLGPIFHEPMGSSGTRGTPDRESPNEIVNWAAKESDLTKIPRWWDVPMLVAPLRPRVAVKIQRTWDADEIELKGWNGRKAATKRPFLYNSLG